MGKKLLIVAVFLSQPLLWAEKPNLNQEGRPWLVVGEMSLTFGFYDWMIPTLFQLHDRQAIGVGMITAGLGFGLPFFLTQNANVSYAQANLAFHGGGFGLVHGMLVNGVLEIYEHQERFTLAASLAENIGGYALAGLTGMSAGSSQLIANFGYFGAGYGASVPVLLTSSSHPVNSRLGYGMPLLGSVAGMAGATVLGKNTRYSYGDAMTQLNLGYLGAGWGLNLYSFFLPKEGATRDVDGKLLYVSGLIGNIGGLYATHRLVGDRHLSGGAGWMLFAATYGGGAFASGIAWLFGPKNIDATYTHVITTAGLIGATATFAITYQALKGKPENHSRFEGQIDPSGLLGLTLAMMRHKDYFGGPIVTIRF
jgi:hypothetical protein